MTCFIINISSEIPKSAFHKNEFCSHAITLCWHKISNTQIRIQIKVSFATPRIFQICNKLHFRFLYWKSNAVHKYWTKFNKTKVRYSAMLIQTSNKVLDFPFLFFKSIFVLLCRNKSFFDRFNTMYEQYAIGFLHILECNMYIYNSFKHLKLFGWTFSYLFTPALNILRNYHHLQWAKSFT